MLASVTANPGAVVKIKINIQIKELKPLKLKTIPHIAGFRQMAQFHTNS